MAKKKKLGVKPRIEAICATTVGDVSEIIVTVNQDGEVSFGQPMSNVFSEVSYAREGKAPKVLSRVPQASAELSFDAWPAILRNFDFVCAVDTNNRDINGRRVSVTAVVSAHSEPPPEGRSAYWRLDVPFCWEFIDLKTDKVENHGWLEAYDQLVKLGIIRADTRVGMIVDADLGNIPSFNRRELSVFGDRLLPEKLQLIYASADTGSENVLNRILQAADSASTQTLDAISSGAVPFNKCDKPSSLYAGRRIVEVHVETYELIF
ncbi:hypothetical protein ATU3C_17810 [Agrobacterium genomosp. 3 str. RTP8]|uniref:hypothetical protein n=1 Tax=Agrobacterium tomkonis TaxID=1183410 RepID=UPI001CDA3B4D|nr:hypothetical protein [Agrobacterium tomkonis RTP8]